MPPRPAALVDACRTRPVVIEPCRIRSAPVRSIALLNALLDALQRFF
ncbi:hypothetical protein I549_3969 [Mycobacterium avium subsp. avium 2285 (R)]|nr:hypothetical protein L837_4908 [Mycobacterium avium MAV_061107_1842]ETZ55377.1 hypothetical protein L840_4099 [Mycobacterium sp. MAC_011194_8550]ETZ68802.1 hypothetical protein L841_1655 [Mycobacterium sp. MAC_080597_8934]EUA41075.1 hypothetical protein I549_3969 [Mycobacterium avium subsp. avium 2285 (R)]